MNQVEKIQEMTGIDKLRAIMKALRAKDGCPWDQKQTHSSLKKYLLEEAYEVLDAVDEGDDNALCSELGDLLLQIVFHSQIAEEDERFDFDSVCNSCSEMLLRRHPHVFDKNCKLSPEEVEDQWERIKKTEKRQQNRSSILDSIPNSMPSAYRLENMHKKAAKHGFDWKDLEQATEKLKEESKEFIVEVEEKNLEKAREELGDVLMVCLNLCRHLDTSLEEISKKACQKYYSRFHSMEKQASRENRSLNELSDEDWERYWQVTKANEKQ